MLMDYFYQLEVYKFFKNYYLVLVRKNSGQETCSEKLYF